MLCCLDTVGERISIECALPWVDDLIAEGSAGALARGGGTPPSLQVRVERDRRPFATSSLEPLTRGAWSRDGEVVLENVCTAGFDVRLVCLPEYAEFTFRWRPPARDRVVGRLLRSRFHLLARAVLLQYPALWLAGTRERGPLHASACIAGTATPLITAPSGIGRSTVILAELGCGGYATGDNLAVGDGTTLWGLVEPLRVAGMSGRRMPHGRSEAPMPNRVEALVPDSIVVLERGRSDRPSLTSCSTEAAARSLVTSTYMAGELRRFWSFASTLAAGTGIGPSHPPVAAAASSFAARLPCFRLTLGSRPGTRLSDSLQSVGVAA